MVWSTLVNSQNVTKTKACKNGWTTHHTLRRVSFLRLMDCYCASRLIIIALGQLLKIRKLLIVSYFININGSKYYPFLSAFRTFSVFKFFNIQVLDPWRMNCHHINDTFHKAPWSPGHWTALRGWAQSWRRSQRPRRGHNILHSQCSHPARTRHIPCPTERTQPQYHGDHTYEDLSVTCQLRLRHPM